jgi:hypothetical protein
LRVFVFVSMRASAARRLGLSWQALRSLRASASLTAVLATLPFLSFSLLPPAPCLCVREFHGTYRHCAWNTLGGAWLPPS